MSGYSSGVNSENGLGITVGQIEAPQPFNNNFEGSSGSQSSSIKTNGGVATGDEED